MLRVLINGIEPVNNPIGIDDLSEKWEYSEQVKIYFVEITGSLTFYGQDFETLFDKFRNSRCVFLPIEIQKRDGDNGSFYSIFNGNIIVQDIDFDFDKRLAVCEIVDNSFIARIYNNNDSQVNIGSLNTISGKPITNGSVLIDVKSTDNVEVTDVPALTLYNALNYVVKWLTDNNVTVESDYLTTDPIASTFYLTTGESLRSQQASENPFPVISFTEIWNDIHRLFHLYGFFYISGGQWVFKVEPFSYFESFSGLHQFNGLKNIIATSLQGGLKNRIIFGSKTNEKEAAIFDNPADVSKTWYIDGFNYYMNGWWNRDEIVIPSQCNTLSTLDLRLTRFISDVNSISKAFREPNFTGYDLEVMIVQPSSEWKHIPLSPFDISGPTPFALRGYFNEPIMNARVLERWFDEICLQGNIDVLRKCEITQTNTSDVLDVTLGFTDVYNPCLGYNAGGGFISKTDGRPDLFDFEYYYIIENTTGSPINVQIQGFGYPSDTTYNDYPGYYNVTRWQTPPSTGWTSPIINPDSDGLQNLVEQVVGAGQTVIYHGFIYDSLLYKDMGFMIMFPILGGATLKAGSYIQIRPKINKILDTNIGCNTYNAEVTAEGFITSEKIIDFRAENFRNILIPNAFKNVTGKLLSLERNITTGFTNLKVKSKTI